MATYFSIQNVAHDIGVSEKTIRRWIDKGIVKRKKNARGHLVFAPEDLWQLKKHAQRIDVE